MIRIAVADDHQVVRHGLRLSLELEPDMTIVGEAATGTEAVAVAGETQPDVMLLDVRLGDIDGPEACRRILLESPKTAVVMLTNYQQDELILRSLLAGAKGYVIKDVDLDELKKMIRSVYRGASVLDPKVTKQVISTAIGRSAASRPIGGTLPGQTVALSETDVAIVRYLSVGLTNKEIGARVNLSPHTVKDHVEKLCESLGVRSRIELVVEAVRRGVI